METKEKVTILVDVKQCARCSQDHDQLKFNLFISPILDSNFSVWNYWALCPVTQEPILLRIQERPSEQDS